MGLAFSYSNSLTRDCTHCSFPFCNPGACRNTVCEASIFATI